MQKIPWAAEISVHCAVAINALDEESDKTKTKKNHILQLSKIYPQRLNKTGRKNKQKIQSTHKMSRNNKNKSLPTGNNFKSKLNKFSN